MSEAKARDAMHRAHQALNAAVPVPAPANRDPRLVALGDMLAGWLNLHLSDETLWRIVQAVEASAAVGVDGGVRRC